MNLRPPGYEPGALPTALSRHSFDNAQSAKTDDMSSIAKRKYFSRHAKFLWQKSDADKIHRMSKKQSLPRRKVTWRVRVMMAEREVRSVSELVRRLDQVGVSISVAQLGRLIDGKTQHWSQEVIEGLMLVLDCELSDLLRSEPVR